MEKNIFVLPTTEPSYVYLVKKINALALTSKDPDAMEQYGSGTHNQNIYLTNKEPYDRGDWCMEIETEEIFKVAEVKEFSGIVRSDTDTYVYDACAKIVFTTDLKLVADDVKEVDRNFLDWFVDFRLGEMNSVDVEKISLLSNNGRALYGFNYKIIIPTNEDPKKHTVILAGEDAVKEERERGITITHVNKQETLQQIDQNNPITRGSTALVYKQDPDQCKTPLDCGKVYNEELTTQTITCTKCGNTHTFSFGGDYYCPSPKQETLQEVAERILANNIDGLRDALKDDDLFFFYKGVVQCYGEAMAEWQKENTKKTVPISDLKDIYQQELFNYLHDELGVIALQSQMHDIETIVDNMQFKDINESDSPMKSLLDFVNKIKINLSNKDELITLQFIIDTIKNEYIDKENKLLLQKKYSSQEVQEMLRCYGIDICSKVMGEPMIGNLNPKEWLVNYNLKK
jgi:hypothetical protein